MDNVQICARITNVRPGVEKAPSSGQTAPFRSPSGTRGFCREKLPVFKSVVATYLDLFAELLDAVEEVLPTLVKQQVCVYVLAEKCTISQVVTFSDKLRRASGEPLPKELRSGVTLASTAVYIYTSGTTGGSSTLSVSALAALHLSLSPPLQVCLKRRLSATPKSGPCLWSCRL